MVFDGERRIVGLGQREHPQYFPHSGWVEHDATQIWSTQAATITEALNRAGISSRDLAAIGITNQRETTVVWDRHTGRPIGPAIVWQDRRTAERCARLLADGHGPLISARTGLLPDSYFSATKLAWLLEACARRAATRQRRRTGLWHHRQLADLEPERRQGPCHGYQQRQPHAAVQYPHRDWDDELLQLFDIPRACLPRVLPCSFSPADEPLNADLDGVAVPISGIAGDQQAALFGQACLSPGMAKNTYGTGCFLLMNTGTAALQSQHHLLATVAWRLGSGALQYALEGSVFVGGAAVQWLRDGLGVIADSARLKPSRARCRIPMGCTSCPPSPGSARLIGTRRRAAGWLDSRAGPRRRISPAPRSKPSPSRAPMC